MENSCGMRLAFSGHIHNNYLRQNIIDMSSILIKDTTSMERIQIVKDALEGEYDEFYDESGEENEA